MIAVRSWQGGNVLIARNPVGFTDRNVLCIVSLAVHFKVAGVHTIFAAYNKSNEVNYEHTVYLE